MNRGSVSTQKDRQCKARLNGTSAKTFEVLILHPESFDIHQIRALCPEEAATQAQFDRRKRDIYKYHPVEKRREGRPTVRLPVCATTDRRQAGPRGITREGKSESHLLGSQAVLNVRAYHRCTWNQRHKIPRTWSGKPVADRAICESCNRGKKNYFKSLDAEAMEAILDKESTQGRILFLPKLNYGKPSSNDFIQFVGSFEDFQED